MKKTKVRIKDKIEEMVRTTNFDGLRCLIKGDPSMREIQGALKRQKEIDDQNKRRYLQVPSFIFS